MTLLEIACVALGGALGSLARHTSSLLCAHLFGDRFYWGTLLVNVAGCFLLGWLLHNENPSSHHTRMVIGTGFLGAFTTFSTFGVQTHQLWERDPILAVANVGANVVLGLVAAGLGLYTAWKWGT